MQASRRQLFGDTPFTLLLNAHQGEETARTSSSEPQHSLPAGKKKEEDLKVVLVFAFWMSPDLLIGERAAYN